jgi:hypothetical protein
MWKLWLCSSFLLQQAAVMGVNFLLWQNFLVSQFMYDKGFYVSNFGLSVNIACGEMFITCRSCKKRVIRIQFLFIYVQT